jgi:VWFA-related protein
MTRLARLCHARPPFAALLASVGLVGGLAAGAQRGERPQFAARLDLVVVDLAAVMNDGRPVTDLTAAELQLTVDGRSRPFSQFAFVRAAAGGATLTAAPNVSPAAEAATLAAATPSGRSFYIIFDEGSMRPGDERQPQLAAIRLVESLSAADKVAVVTLHTGVTSTDLSSDKVRHVSALRLVRGRLPIPPGTGDQALQRACLDFERSNRSLVQLTDFLTSLRHADGPKTVIVVSSGWLPPSSRTNTSSGPSCARTSVGFDGYNALGRAAAEGRAQLYLIQPHGFLIEAGGQMREPLFFGHSSYHDYLDDQLIGLETLAGVTGGELFRVSGEADRVFARIVLESSAYYLLTFESLASERDGKLHKISVKTSRRNVTIRSRPTFAIPAR